MGAARNAGVAERSAKAGKHFEDVKAKLGDVQRQQADASAEQQRRLDETLAQKEAAHSAGIAERGAKAGKHFEDVKVKLGDVQRQQADASDEQQRRLDETLAQKEAARTVGIAERGSKAGQHNDRVAEKVLKHQEETQRRMELLRQQQHAAQQKASELREQAAQHKADELREQLRRKATSTDADRLVSTTVAQQNGNANGDTERLASTTARPDGRWAAVSKVTRGGSCVCQ